MRARRQLEPRRRPQPLLEFNPRAAGPLVALAPTGRPAGSLSASCRTPRANVRVAAEVLAEKGGDLGSYNGATTRKKRDRYASKIAALVSAFGGVEVPVRGRRLREMVRKVVAAVSRFGGELVSHGRL